MLSLLMRQPAHGYLIAKVLNNIIGPIARASNGRIYPLLAKLEEAGLIVASDEEQDGRQVRTYRITEGGRSRFHELMMDTTSSPREYQELFSFKVSVFPFLAPEERVFLVDHYIHYCRAHVMHLRSGAQELQGEQSQQQADPAGVDALLGVMQHRISQWELEVAWAINLRQIVGQMNNPLS